MYVFRLPWAYVKPDALPQHVKIFEDLKVQITAALPVGTKVVYLPSDRDPETRQYLFVLEEVK